MHRMKTASRVRLLRSTPCLVGDYRVTRETDYSPGTVIALYSGPRVRVGLWALATSAYVNANDAVVHLDSMDRKPVWARFEFRGRRQHGGV